MTSNPIAANRRSASRAPRITGITARTRIAPKEIQLRHIANCMRADRAYGEGVAKALGISGSELR
jgi:catalase